MCYINTTFQEVQGLNQTLGELLEELRGKMSLREAAAKSGLSYTYIRDIERGYNRSTKAPIKPSPETLQRLAKAYNYPYEELMKSAGYMEEAPEAQVDDIDPELLDALRNVSPEKQKKVLDYLAGKMDSLTDSSVTRLRFLKDAEQLTPEQLKRRYRLEIEGETASAEEIDEAVAFIRAKRLMKGI